MSEYHSDLFSRLTQEKRAVLLYGMGNGADKIIAHLESKGIGVADVFASDGFVRGQVFHEKQVLSLSQIKERYAPDQCVVLLAFGSARPDVLDLIQGVAATYELLVPDMPVCGGPVFDAQFFAAHQDEIKAARELFADDASKQLYDRIIDFRLSGSLETLLFAVSEKSAWDYLTASPRPIRRIADLGAYNGDSAREALNRFPLDFILAAEPDRRNFRKLSEWSGSLRHCEVECHQVAICDLVGTADFDDSGNRNAGLCTGKAHIAVSTATLDSLLCGRAVDYIKYDIEGAEARALEGSMETIGTYTPALRIALYHRSADLFSIPLQLCALVERYDFYLTRERSVPAWDIDLVAIPKNS